MMVNGHGSPVLTKATCCTACCQDLVPKAGVFRPAPRETWTVPNTGNKAHERLAAKVVSCLNSNKNQLLMGKQRQVVPTKLALQPAFVRANPAMQAFSTVVKTARSRTGQLGADWPKAATKIFTGEQCALTNEGTPEKCLAQAQSGG